MKNKLKLLAKKAIEAAPIEQASKEKFKSKIKSLTVKIKNYLSISARKVDTFRVINETPFIGHLRKTLADNQGNYFFGGNRQYPDFMYNDYYSILDKQKSNIIGTSTSSSSDIAQLFNQSLLDFDGLSNSYDVLQDKYSKETFVRIIAYRMLGPTKIKMPLTNINLYDKFYALLAQYTNEKHNHEIIVKHKLYDLNPFGYSLNVFGESYSLFLTFLLEQYVYNDIKVEDGDYVIDGGGCYGDTALYFASKAGKCGKVFSFEFLPENLKIFNENLYRNSNISKNIEVNSLALWENNKEDLYVVEAGPATQCFRYKPKKYDFKVNTISIDQFVSRNSIEKVDFIKLDIEGAEFETLKGALETIKKFKPKLAICLYHDIAHFSEIPNYLKEILPEYKFYFDHFTTHLGESVLFAKVKD